LRSHFLDDRIASLEAKLSQKRRLIYSELNASSLFQGTGVDEDFLKIKELLIAPNNEIKRQEELYKRCIELKNKEIEKFHSEIKTALRDQQKLQVQIVRLDNIAKNKKEAEEIAFQKENLLFLDANGVTIKCYEWAKVGDLGTINVKQYMVVSYKQLGHILRYGTNAQIESICTSKITSLDGLHPKPGCDISHWDVSNVESFGDFFRYGGVDLDIAKWDVSNVEDMSYMFFNSKFNGDISEWDVSNVTHMSSMFSGTKFNGDISEWDVSNVEDMSSMFSSSEFNGDISKWDVSNVKDMSSMFWSSKFSGDISKWDFSHVHHCENFNYNNELMKFDILKLVNCRGF